MRDLPHKHKKQEYDSKGEGMYKKSKTMKAIAFTLASAMALTALPMTNVLASNPVISQADYENVYANEGYKLVWHDEFDSVSLNTADWNVEDHEPGWVNEELQRYVTEADMDDNIKLQDGSLVITPTAVKNDEINPELLSSNEFSEAVWGSAAQNDGGKGSVAYADGKAVVTIEDHGTSNSGVQIQTTGLTLTKGHEYAFSMKASSTVARKTEVTLITPAGWKWYGGKQAAIGTEEGDVSFNFTVSEETCDNINLQLNFGLIGGSEDDSKAAVVTLSDVSLVDLSAENTAEADVKRDYSYASGRINTQNKHDFTYGRFEARVKVPTGQGYLPAFWLMASDESNYGQWPQCGEMDIMEVMGQDTKTSYHTIHYGYDADTARENQGILELKEGDFSEEYHIFTLDWEPGKITWYVDGNEVYTTDDWFTGKDPESHLTYPAPFDQDFYIILNLAVGGKWVGYPTQEVLDDILAGEADQSLYVDYVRVYQKDKEDYEQQEATAERPVQEVTVREPDANGNYVVNGDFSKDIKEAGTEGDNFELHLESDGKGSTWKVENNQIVITPAAAGLQNHSVQLKQEGIPMYKDCEYEVSFDAYAAENRSIIVDIEGPDNGWKRYFEDTKVDLTTTKQSYTYTFTMNDRTDLNGCLEFNLGNQESTAPVTISNVKVIVKSGEIGTGKEDKTVRADGNYIYNGAFDQGDKRLGYWEFSDADAANISVTNKDMVRQLKVTVKDTPVTLRQSDLPRIIAGEYELGFDAYMEEGSAADAMTVTVSDRKFAPELTETSQHFSKDLLMRDNVESKDAWVEITFSKPGTYYLDNVMLGEALLIKNGSFKAGLAGFAPYIYTTGQASYVVDSINN